MLPRRDVQSVVEEEVFPKIERSLDQLEAQSRKLLQKAILQKDINGESKAHFLLAGKGFDAEKVSQTLNSISVAQTFEPVQSLMDTNIDGFLHNEHELVIVEAIEEARQKTLKDHEKRFEQKLQTDWEHSKRVILQSLGNSGVVGRPGGAVKSDSLAVSMFQMDARSGQKTPMTAAETLPACLAYAQATKQLNDYRLQNRTVSISMLYEEASKKHSHESITKSWELVSYLINRGKEQQSKNKRYSEYMYDDEQAKSMRSGFAQGGRKWLEAYFRKYLDEHIFRSMKAKEQAKQLHSFDQRDSLIDDSKLKANVSKMSNLQKIQIWTRDILMAHSPASTWEIVDGFPFWATLFYLIRSGAKEDALRFVAHYEKYLSKTDRRFTEYFSAWCQHERLPRKLRNELIGEFNSRIRDNILRSMPSSSSIHRVMSAQPMATAAAADPYKYLIYRIMGRIGLDDTAVPQSVVKLLAGKIFGWEDDLWFQLCLVKEDSQQGESSRGEEAAEDRFTLQDMFERYVGQIAVEQWTLGGQHPVRYFQILLLCGQFERACQYLWKVGQFHVDAFHFALALFYCGVLHLVNDTDSIQLDIGSMCVRDNVGGTRKELFCINISRLLSIYTSSILCGASYPVECLQYLLILCSDDSPEYRQLCYNGIVDLVLLTGQIDEFFGTIPHGQRVAGLLDLYTPLMGIHDWDAYKKVLIRPAAEKAEKMANKALLKSEFTSHSAAPSATRSRHEDRNVSIQPQAEAELQTNNALLLYNLAEDYNTVLDILCKRVSELLNEQSVESLADAIINKLSSTAGQLPIMMTGGQNMERLVSMEKSTASVLNYYGSQPGIVRCLESGSRKTLSTLVGLLQFYRLLYSAVFAHLSRSEGRVEMDVRKEGAGFSIKLSNASGEWSEGLVLISDLGIVPLSTAPGTVQQQSDVDFAKLLTKAEHLRREFSDLILSHLGDIFLGVEILIFIGCQESRQYAKIQSGMASMDFNKKSRELLSFVSAVGRWYKVAGEVRGRLVKLDEML